MNYFITGATGFIGRYLVRELLSRTTGANATVYVLARRASDARLAQLRTWWGADAARIVAIEGDLTRPALGLAAADCERLRGRIDHFFHLGAIYDLSADAASMEAANVAGTRNALELAQLLGARRFHLTSSIASAGLYPGVFTEAMFEEARGLEHPYFRTKHDSEGLVRAQHRLPWRIYRPGMVIGHSRTGHITKVDGPYYFFKTLQILRRHLPAWLPTIGLEGGYVNVVPVDYVVAAIAHLAHLPDLDGRCFHLTDPNPRHAGELLNLFARAGHAPLMGLRIDTALLRHVPVGVMRTLSSYGPLRAIGEQLLDDLQIPRTVLEFLNLPTRFENTRTRELLEAADIRLPPLEDYAWRIWDYWERHLDPDLSLDRSLAGAVCGKRVLITGGSSGIGKATASKLAAAGATMLIAARNPDKLAQARAEIAAAGSAVHTYACDITNAAACAELAGKVQAEHGGIDILINNAGRSIRRAIAVSYERFHDYERLMELNYYAAVRLTLAFLPGMVAQRSGQVIVISSIGVLSSAPRFSGYVASKAALEAFTRCASAEYRDQGVHFTVINMPLVRTPMIAPTRIYEQLPAISPEEAANFVADAVIHKPPRIATRLGVFARLVELFAPRLGDVVNNASFHMYPDSAAALGIKGPESPPSDDAVAFAQLLKGLHW